MEFNLHEVKVITYYIVKSHLLLIGTVWCFVVRDFIAYLLFPVRAHPWVSHGSLLRGILATRPLVFVEPLMEAGPIESLVESLMKAYSSTKHPIKTCPGSSL